MSETRNPNGKRNTVIGISLMLGVMVALTAAAVPLYQLFCQVTGYGGTTNTAEAAPGADSDAPLVTIRFNADTARGMAWDFEPMQREVTARVGEQVTVFYEASNPTDRAIAGTSTYNVTPQKVGEYFAKIDCFCFTEQVLQPGMSVAMPVTFFVDPELVIDPLTEEVRTITLSYTFFEMEGTDITTNAALVEETGTAAN
ncbi:MAG: cytochrome c oxidase assembly protein [Rhodospirillaceae bacterium]|nr:cytochrome c oxidase assembly protein [Rhodospirillaceae bacterium]|tara:strand:+ start:512 stop:1108 length:597 start_codon:yes stop_codon:yes gene_type:complete